MWNLSLRDPIIKGNYTQNTAGSSGNASSSKPFSNGQNKGRNGTKGGGSTGKGSKKPKYCWAWNKGGTCKFGVGCDFVNRCSYCDVGEHGLNTCPKKAKENN